MRKILIVAAVALAVPAWAADKPEITPPGAWVRPAPTPKNGAAASMPDGAPVQVIRLDQQVRFGADADERYTETAIRILTPQGLAGMGTIALPWQPDTSTLTIHKLHIVRGNERIDVLASGQQFTVLRREEKLESAILSGILTAAIQPEGLQVGDIVELAATIRFHDPVLGDHSEHVADMPFALPGGRMHISAQWPSARQVNWRKSDLMPAPKLRQEKDVTYLELTLDNPETLVPPKDAPARFLPARRIEFTSYRGWDDLSAVMAPLYDKAAAIPEGSPLAAEVARIHAASSDPKLRAAAALKLVQDRVRYVFQGMNSGNLLPASAADTWSRRFGDCKGKTALLLALLRALDISAEPAAVSTMNGDGLDARLPMVGLLDHILVRAEISGKTYWLDGTRLGDSDLDGIPVPPFRWALPVRTGGTGLVAMVQPPLEEPSETTTVWIDASKGIGLPAPIEVTVLIRGGEAFQLSQQLGALSPKDMDAALKAYWQEDFKFITPEEVSAKYDPKTGEQTVTIIGTAALGWTDYGYRLDGAGLGWRADYKRDPGPNAEAPIANVFPYYTAYKTTILLPHEGRGFTVQGDDVDTKAGGYAFQRRTRIEDGVLTMEASTRALEREISYADALTATETISALDKGRVVVRTPKDYQRTSAEQDALFGTEPRDARGFVERGSEYLDTGELDKAIADFDKAITLDANSAIAFADRGIARAWKGEAEAALADLDRAAALEPRLPYIFHGRAIVLEKERDFGGAIAALTRAIDLKEDNLWALGRRAGLYRMQGDDARALADAAAMLKIEPTDASALYFRHELQTEAGNYTDALATLDELAKLTPDPEGLTMQRAYVLARMGKAAEARGLFATLRGKATKSASVLNDLCWTQAQANFDLEQALADCEASIKLETRPAVLDSSGLVLLRMGRFDEAIERYDGALAKAPDLAPSLYGRGIAKLRKGDPEGGQADLKAAAAQAPSIARRFAAFGVSP